MSSSLKTSSREIFAKMSRLDICKPIRLHNIFLLKYNNNKYLRTHDNYSLRPVSINSNSVQRKTSPKSEMTRQVICDDLPGCYNSRKHGNLREFVNSGKLREKSGNLKFTQGIYMILILSLWHRVMCIIVSNSSVNWLGDTVTGVDRVSHHAHSIKYSVILQESCRTKC